MVVFTFQLDIRLPIVFCRFPLHFKGEAIGGLKPDNLRLAPEPAGIGAPGHARNVLCIHLESQ